MTRNAGTQRFLYQTMPDGVPNAFLSVQTARRPNFGLVEPAGTGVSAETAGVLPSVTATPSLVFFLAGVGLTYPWSAINAAVDTFVGALGGESYIVIQAAFYMPLLPCLLLQIFFDEK